MACNSCAKSYSLLRKEKGCPGCGFSYCSKCLDNKVFVPKLNAEAKVCSKCKNSITTTNEKKHMSPPDAYFRRLGLTETKESTNTNLVKDEEGNQTDQEILNRLSKLREDRTKPTTSTTEDIAKRLQNIKGDIPSTSDAELHLRLAKLKGLPETTSNEKPILAVKDLRTEQEQIDDLMKQYIDQAKIDTQYKTELDNIFNDIESRIQKLKGSSHDKPSLDQNAAKHEDPESEDDEEVMKKIIQKAKAEALLEQDEMPPSTNDELPFCEICNEDAQMRCLGCRYLFCKRCFTEHKDDDDGCNKYELYKPPKGSSQY